MRHLRKGRKLKRTASHRKALLSNLATSLFKNDSKRIKTTVAKAKEARILIDNLITKAKRATASGAEKILHAKREIYKIIKDRDVINSIFTEVVPKIQERSGGYSRVVKIGRRLGDAAELAILELVDFNIAQEKEAASKSKDKKESSEKTEKKKSEKIEEAEVVEEKETVKEPKKEKPVKAEKKSKPAEKKKTAKKTEGKTKKENKK